MRTTERFEKAVRKLYTAFHEGTLDLADCQRCAVGNICDESGSWTAIIGCSNVLGNYESAIEYASKVYFENEREKGFEVINKTGYSPRELHDVEAIFMQETEDNTKDEQFKGLCAVVEYLAELDNIPNPMDYSILFETENNEPKYKLEEVNF